MNDLLDVLRKANELMQEGEIYWFRGQADEKHTLVPSVFRPRQDGSYYDEAKLLKEFVRQHPEARDKHANTFELLTYAQHYGLPTRLLDWTKNLLVAIFFACKVKPDTPTDTDTDGKVFIYILTDELERAGKRMKTYEDFVTSTDSQQTYLDMLNSTRSLAGSEYGPIFINNKYLNFYDYPISSAELAFIKRAGDPPKLYIQEEVEYDSYLDSKVERKFVNIEIEPMSISIPYEPFLLNKRLITQHGVFTIHGGKIINCEAVVKVVDMETESDSHRVQSLIISAKSKYKILQQLETLGISESILFPELEYQTRHIKYKCVNHPRRAFNPEDF
ncbi:FRG domain-containing protein [Shewanella baltica]|uniref:FRG domain-containing protein n=1 Tax=Shewanella baltica TaxID=62322 RepID=UPI00217D1CFF|nr:FRG domain-containing protein [Shewanella baltica]MCS6178927.1 FRG domain-containing protein [Shewanella baltica]MCS6255091.1 FRG domain-containing protein [Shewanella baltica]